MKTNTHPQWYDNTKVTCSCGNTFETGSVLPEISVEICAQCHPFFTGEMKFIDTQGRVEKFQKMQEKAAKLQSKLGAKNKAKQEVETQREQPKTLKEMMQTVKKSSKPSANKSPKQ